MTTMHKEITSEHIIAYGRKVNGDTITFKFQFHPSIQQWLEENGIVPEYKHNEQNTKNYDISGYEKTDFVGFREHEIKNSKRDIDNILKNISITVPLTKHQYKFMFPVFKKTPVLKLTHEEKINLLNSKIWDEKTFVMNS